MVKRGTKKIEDRDKDFAKLEHLQKVGEKPDVRVADRVIFFDGTQFVCKLPKNLMKEVWREGSKLKFRLITLRDNEPKLEVQFLKNGTE